MGLFDFFRKKDKPAKASDSATRHCFVLCKDAAAGDLSQASHVVAKFFGPGHSVEVSNTEVSITRGENTVGFLAHIPKGQG